MRAAAVTAPGRVEVIDIPEPTIGPYDVLCEAQFGSVCAGTDTHVVDGGFGPTGYPKIIGHETVGRVIEVGAKVKTFATGDLIARVSAPESRDGAYVLAWGGLVEHPIAKDAAAMAMDGVPRAEWERFRINQIIPGGVLPLRYSTMFITWRETLSYLLRSGLGKARRVVVSGSGANGIAMCALLRALGADEIVLVGSAARRSRCLGRAADHYLSYRDVDELERFARERAGEFDGLIDATGISGSIDALLPVLRPQSVVGVYGLDDGSEYAIRPLGAPTFTLYNGGYDEAETHTHVVDLIEHGLLDPTLWIDDETFGWDSIEAAFEMARSRRLIKPLIDLRRKSEAWRG